MKKYWYEEGFCRHLQYKGLWPILYQLNDNSNYEKKCMVCSEIENGKCKIKEKCEVLKNAKKEIERYDEWKMNSKKLK